MGSYKVSGEAKSHEIQEQEPYADLTLPSSLDFF